MVIGQRSKIFPAQKLPDDLLVMSFDRGTMIVFNPSEVQLKVFKLTGDTINIGKDIDGTSNFLEELVRTLGL